MKQCLPGFSRGTPLEGSAPSRGRALAWMLMACLAVLQVEAFPPAPHHEIYGMVRDELGNPLNTTKGFVTLVSQSGVELKTAIVPGREEGVNYRLIVPMDTGLTADEYRPSALLPTVPFRMQVQIEGVVYLPIEMRGEFSKLGEPAACTRLDLTLGEDSDGDGIPDAWERALIAALGRQLSLSDIRPGDDTDQDGLQNLQEYPGRDVCCRSRGGFPPERHGGARG
ncbi:MAG: hypothetical protein AB9869_00270 [Verrucomicrobiia bacterium]